MPSPFAHLVTGFALSRGLSGPDAAPRMRRRWLGLSLVMSLAPDGDAVLGALCGDMAGWHNQATHAPIMLPLAGLLAAVFWRVLGGRAVWRAVGLGVCAYAAHLAMDFWTVSRGAMLLWPWMAVRFQPPFPLFYGLRWSDGLLSPRHLITLGSELLTLGALAAAWALWRRWRGRIGADEHRRTP